MGTDVLALIPARGGSKGIPRKNILELLGRPLLAYVIEQAEEAVTIDRIIVSTDDEEIAKVARRHGAEVPFMRPARFADDLSPDIEAFRHALEWCRDQERLPDLVVHLRPTQPVRDPSLIDEAVGLMQAHPEADALRSVSLARQSPYKMWRKEADGTLRRLLTVEGLTDAQSMPRQLLPLTYWQNGYVDVVRPATVLEKGSMTGDVTMAFEVDDDLLELDYPEDIPPIEEALRRRARGGRQRAVAQQRADLTRHPV